MEITLSKIESVVKLLDLKWKVGDTGLSAIPEEKLSRYLGLRVTAERGIFFERKKKAAAAAAPPTPPPIPPQIDWRNKEGNDWMTSVKNQGASNACVAFACVGAIESLNKIKKNEPNLSIDLSEAFLFFCGGGNWEEGWHEDPALNFAKIQGITDEDCFPWPDPPEEKPCEDRCKDWENRLTKIKDWQEIFLEDDMKSWIANHGPAVVGMDVYDDFIRGYTGGIFEHAIGNYRGAHAIVIVGYNNEEKYWICKNSWGTRWGESGWFKIKFRECGIGIRYQMFGIEA